MTADEMRRRRDAASEPRAFVRPEGAFFNMALVRQIHGHWDTEAALALQASGIDWHEIGAEVCVRAEDLAALFAGGVFGNGDVMRGRLHIIRLLTPSDFKGLPFPSGAPEAGGIAYGSVSLAERFERAKDALVLAQNCGALGDHSAEVHDLPEPVRIHGWAAVGGDPRRGRVAALADALPIEIGWDNRRRIMLYIRTLKGAAVAPKEAQAAVAGDQAGAPEDADTEA